MKKRLSLFLSAMLVFSALTATLLATPVSAAATATKISGVSELVDGGQYIIATTTDVLVGCLDGTWVKSATATITDGVVSGPVTYIDAEVALEAVLWTVKFDGTYATLTDANGVTIAPKTGNNNGIQKGEYAWQVVESNGAFSFCGTGTDTTKLAYNKTSDGFRSYKNTTATDTSATYISKFYLYVIDSENAPTAVTPSTASKQTRLGCEACGVEAGVRFMSTIDLAQAGDTLTGYGMRIEYNGITRDIDSKVNFDKEGTVVTYTVVVTNVPTGAKFVVAPYAKYGDEIALAQAGEYTAE